MLSTTIAGSLPKPAWLAEPEKLWAPWRRAGAELEQAKQDAALVWIKEQEACGIDIVSNGEQFRVHFVHGFLESIEGIGLDQKDQDGYPRQPCTNCGMAPLPRAVAAGKLRALAAGATIVRRGL